MKLNQKIVDALTIPRGKKDATFWDDDCPGLGARLQGKARRWIVRYRVTADPKQKQITLGPIAGMPLRKAREIAVEYTMSAKQGVDRAAALRAGAVEAQRLQQVRTEGRLGVLAERYLEYAKDNLKPKTIRDLRYYLTKTWAPLHDQVVEDLDYRDIVKRLEAIAADSGGVTSNRARSALSGCFAWAVMRGIIQRNPLVGTRRLAVEKSRERVLSTDELVALWKDCDRQEDFAQIVKLLILTGQRRGEVAGMRWHEIDLARRLWTIPSERVKNGNAHQVPLSSQAMTIIETQAARPDQDLLFGTGRKGYCNFFEGRKKSDERTGLAGWTLHDLRRTAVTGMAEMGVQPHVVEAVVNHISGHKSGVAGIYNRATYAAEKRAALQRWADHVSRLVGEKVDSTVVQMPVAR